MSTRLRRQIASSNTDEVMTPVSLEPKRLRKWRSRSEMQGEYDNNSDGGEQADERDQTCSRASNGQRKRTSDEGTGGGGAPSAIRPKEYARASSR